MFCLTILRWIESSKEHNLSEIEIFCDILNAFIVTFDQSNAPVLKISLKNKVSVNQTYDLVA